MSVQGSGNRFLTTDLILKESLRRLKNALVLCPRVYRSPEQHFGAGYGDTISLRLPYRTKTAAGRTLVKQPAVDTTVPLTINNQQHFGIEVVQRDMTLTMERFYERYLKSGIIQLANVIDRSVAFEFTKAFYSSGTPGTGYGTNDFHIAKAHMENAGVVDDGQISFAMNPLDSAAISNAISTKFNEDMVKKALQKGYVGPLANVDLLSTPNVYGQTVGAHGGTPVTNGADQTGASIITDGWTNSTQVLNQGDVITFAAVNQINPQTYATVGQLMRFVVTADVTSDGSGNATIPISPSINDGSLTSVDADGNTISLAAYQNVDAAVADGAAISVIGTASTAYRMGYMFHKDAVALAMVEMDKPETAVIKERVTDEDSGLSLLLTGGYDIQNNSQVWRIDALWGVKAIYPELMHKIYSA